jgi:phage minor structural protein
MDMINLYEKSEKNFKHNAYILNEASKAVVEEEINGSFELDFSYPLNDSKDLSRMLVTGSIIKVPTWDKRENQLFVIRRAKPSIDNLNVEVYAQHILISKLDNDVILDTNIVSKTRKQAIEQILNNTLNKHNFTAGSKDSNTDINNLRIVRYSPLEALIGEKIIL